MDDPVFEKLLERTDSFKPRQSYKFLDFTTTGSSPGSNETNSAETGDKELLIDTTLFRWGDISAEQVQSWAKSTMGVAQLSSPASPTPSFHTRILFIEYDNYLNLCCSPELFRALYEAWQFPSYTLHMFMSGTRPGDWFEQRLAESQSTIFGCVFYLDSFRSIVAYDVDSRLLNVLVSCTDAKREQLERAIKTCYSATKSPALIPLIMLEQELVNISQTLLSRGDVFIDLDDKLDMDPFIDRNEPISHEVNYEDLVRTLTKLSRGLLMDKGNIETISATIDAVHRMQNNHNTITGDTTLSANITSRLCSLASQSKLLEQSRQEMLEESQILMQTLYCLVATYENKLSRKATEASVHLATESRTIAEQSKHIAVLTRRDSNDMRIIALLTMIFLPGAFVGTFFSSSFFNFGPAAGNAVVSHWIWLYLLITALLTIIVFSGWHLLSRAKSKKEEEFI